MSPQNLIILCSFSSLSSLANYSRSFLSFYYFFFFLFICGRSSITKSENNYISHWLLYPFDTVHRYQWLLESHLPAYLWVFTVFLLVIYPYAIISAYVFIIIYLIMLQPLHCQGMLHQFLFVDNHLWNI